MTARWSLVSVSTVEPGGSSHMPWVVT
jgi:hypothetical protein